MSWLSELIAKAVEENWCTSTSCGLCIDRGFRLSVKEQPREKVIDDLLELSQEICDRYWHILVTVFTDVSLFRGIDAGTDLLDPLKGTPAGTVLESAIRHAQVRYEQIYFHSPEAANSVRSQTVLLETRAQ